MRWQSLQGRSKHRVSQATRKNCGFLALPMADCRLNSRLGMQAVLIPQSEILNPQSVNSQLIKGAVVVAPMLAHLDEEIQEDMPAQKFLDVAASRDANLLQTRTPSPDYNSSVRRALDVDQTVNSS